MKNYPDIGIQAPKVVIPNKHIEMRKWAVIACDQFTSQPSYWEQVDALVGESPSTYNLILPEAYLGTTIEPTHSAKVNQYMEKYLESDIFQEIDGMIYVERYFDNSVRKGLIAALDLERYDFSEGSQSLIRATEGTIIDRLPPRIKIRNGALLEVPHILVLIDDPEMSVIDPISKHADGLEVIYDFELMQNSGRIKGFQIASSSLENSIIGGLRKLESPGIQSQKYSTSLDTPPLLFAVGDGNHSLATAKAIWDQNKLSLPDDHPSRYALVEIVNLHDASIRFEPIHRLLKGVSSNWMQELEIFFDHHLKTIRTPDLLSTKQQILDYRGQNQVFGIFDSDGFWFVELEKPLHTLTVGSIQKFIDAQITNSLIKDVDYIHGDQAILELGIQKENAAIYLSAIRKDSFFQSVITDGSLPRKTFSMGESYQKRFYLECRRIK